MFAPAMSHKEPTWFPRLNSLGEDSTEPLDEAERQVNISPAMLNPVFRQFKEGSRDTFLSLGAARISRVFYDQELDLPHVWIVWESCRLCDQLVITEKIIRSELVLLSNHLTPYFPQGFAVSAEMR